MHLCIQTSTFSCTQTALQLVTLTHACVSCYKVASVTCSGDDTVQFSFHADRTEVNTCYRLKQAFLSKRDLPDGEFLSFDSILKSFFSSSVKNLLSPQSGQHPSTVFTRSPLLLALVLSLYFPSICFFSPSCILSHRKAVAGGGCGLDCCPTLLLSTVNRKLEPENPWSQVCCYTWNKAERVTFCFLLIVVLGQDITNGKKEEK